MWFKQIQLFQLAGKPPKKADTLTEKLHNFEFQDCLASTPSSHGWTSPIDLEQAPIVHAANGYLMMCLKIEEKILPATVIRQAVEDKVRQLEDEDNRLSRQAKADLKSEITFSLLPRAFSKYTRVYAYIDPNLNLLLLNTANKRHTELFIDAMQKTLPLVKLQRPDIKRLRTLMTQWLINDDAPKGFWVEKSCVLQDSQYQARVIRCKEQELSANPIVNLVTDGCEVKQLAMMWAERVQFNLSDDFVFRSVKYAEELIDQAKSLADQDAAQQFDADFAIMTETLHEFFAALLPEVLQSHEIAEPALEA